MTRALLFGCLFLLASASLAHAQFFSRTTLERELTLTLSPAHPEPGHTVKLTVEGGFDFARSLVVWYADDEEIARGIGHTETSVVAGEAGEETRVRVVARDDADITASAETSIRPTQVDLLWEALSYVPPFYGGRALPGADNPIRAYAFTHFPRANGSSIPEADIVYTWYRNDTIVTKGRGKSAATLPGPDPFGSATYRVFAEAADRSLSGEASVRLSSSDPFALIYENHPLFGILYHRALEGSVNTLETEQKVTAVPYFADITTLSDPSLLYAWRVNGGVMEPDEREPQTLTISARDFSGPADVEITVTSLSDLLLQAVGKSQLIFGSESSSFFSNLNPFGRIQ